jgi:AraC-like DNA-binding protein
MSIPAFTRFFKKTTGRTFTSYLNELRISYACRMLIESDLSISEIAFKAGFRNLSNLNRRFLNLKRVSPKIYRQQMIESASNIAVPGSAGVVGRTPECSGMGLFPKR